MSQSPRPVLLDAGGEAIVLLSKHEQDCATDGCARPARLGFDSSGEGAPVFLCVHCIGEALSEL